MDELTFTDGAGVEIFYRRWAHDAPKGVVLIAHGASEHSGRYGRFAAALNQAGYAAYAPDQRGHGRTAAATGVGRMGPPGGGGPLIDDLESLRLRTANEYPGVPVVAFGHSLGSAIMLAYLVAHSDLLAGSILCGFPAPADDPGAVAALFKGMVDAGQGDEPAVGALASFNQPFEPARTPFDWLSRDPAEVDKYIADPFCGDNHPLTYGYFADVFETVAPAMESLGTIRGPVWLIAGDHDPAAGMGANVTGLEQAMKSAGVDVSTTLYPDARHELLNETNRDAVTADVVAWIDGRVGA